MTTGDFGVRRRLVAVKANKENEGLAQQQQQDHVEIVIALCDSKSSLLFCTLWFLFCSSLVFYLEKDRLFRTSAHFFPSWPQPEMGRDIDKSNGKEPKQNRNVFSNLDIPSPQDDQGLSEQEGLSKWHEESLSRPLKPGSYRGFVDVSNQPEKRGLPEEGLEALEPGERGTGVILSEEQLGQEDKERREGLYQRHAFEAFVSEAISLERSIPDWRPPWCLETYPVTAGLPQTSVIICFHNEALSTLLRTVMSIVNRSPHMLLHEILLVDDASSLDHLGAPLEDSLSGMPRLSKVTRIIRLSERHGLMRCRMKGILEAKSDVLTFLDSHIEASPGWLEPLMHRIHENPNVIVSPVIDAINDTTFHYTYIDHDIFGMFNWAMEFEWHDLPQSEILKKPNKMAPHKSPVMAGGLFSITKARFEELGLYDEGMHIWGGENLELSFKAWMCPQEQGDLEENGIEIVPCSHVGHVFRTWSPYHIQAKQIHRNNIRVAEVWMDEFKYLVFDRLGKYEKALSERLGDYGDVNLRKRLRSDLKCKPFQWYLDSVVKTLPYHTLKGAGEIKNLFYGLCLDKDDNLKFLDQQVDLLPCHNEGGHQYWWFGTNSLVFRDYSCIGVMPDGLTISVMDCGKVRGWHFDEVEGLLHQLGQMDKCMEIVAQPEEPTTYNLQLRQCQPGNTAQMFVISKYNGSGLSYSDLALPTVPKKQNP